MGIEKTLTFDDVRNGDQYKKIKGGIAAHGLSKREWFAGMALIALAGKIKLSDEIIARYSVDVADAVMAELDKKKEEK